MNDQARKDLGTDRMRLELEGGDHAEVAAAAPEPPKEIGVLRFARDHDAPVRQHDPCREQVVDGHPVLATEPSEPAPEG